MENPPADISQAIALVRQGQKEQARPILLTLLQADPANDIAWIWLIETLDSVDQRLEALEQCLKLNPQSLFAQKALTTLRANAEAQVLASQPPPPPSSTPLAAPPSPLAPPSTLHPPRSTHHPIEIVLLILLVILISGAIALFWWLQTGQRSQAQSGTATRAAVASTLLTPALPALPRSSAPLLPSTLAPPSTPSATPPLSGTGLLYFTGDNGCDIGWINTVDDSGIQVGRLAPEWCGNELRPKSWSPDGLHFALAVMEPPQGSAPGAYSIQVMRYDGLPEFQLVTGHGVIAASDMLWSPDGRQLAYVVSTQAADGADIFSLQVVKVNGTDQSDDGILPLTEATLSLEASTLPGPHVAWSPDGSRLALIASDRDKTTGLYLTSTQGNSVRKLIGSLAMNVPVVWSSDGRQILYQDGMAWKVLEPDGSQPPFTAVTGDNTADIFCLTWSPDGQELLCLVHTSREQQLLALKLDSSQEMRVLAKNAPSFDLASSSPRWSPDRQGLALRDTEQNQLYLYDLSRAGLRSLKIAATGDFTWAIFGTPSPPLPDTPTPTLPPSPTPALSSTPSGPAQYLFLDSFQVGPDPLNSLAYSPDGQLMAVGSADGSVYLFDSGSHQLQTRLELAHLEKSSAVLSLAFSQDGQILAAGYQDATIQLWDVAAHVLARTLKGHTGPVWSLSFHPVNGYLGSGSEDGSVRIWDPTSGELIAKLSHPGEKVWSVAFPPGPYVIAAGTRLRIQGFTSGEVVRSFSPEGLVSSVALDSSGEQLISAGKALESWDQGTEKRLLTFQGHTDWVWSVVFSRDGQTLASASKDKTVRVWDPRTGELRQTLTGHLDSVNSVAFSPDGQQLAAAGEDGVVILWKLGHPATPAPAAGQAGAPGSVKIAYAVTSSTGEAAISVVSPPEKPEEIYRLAGSERVQSLLFSPDGQQLYYTLGASDAQQVFAIDSPNAQPRLLLTAPPPVDGFSHFVTNITWQPGASHLVLEIKQANLMSLIAGYLVLDPDSGATVMDIPQAVNNDSKVLSTFSPDRKMVAAVGTAGISLVNLETGQVFPDLITYPAVGMPNTDAFFFPDITWSADSSFFMTAVLTPESTWENQQMNVVRVASNGQVEFTVKAPGTSQGIAGAYPKFTPDGGWMFYYGNDGLHRWNIHSDNDQFIAPLSSDGYRWEYASISPDGQQLLFTGIDGLYWLSVATGQFQKFAPPGSIRAWSPDSRRCAVQITGQSAAVVSVDGGLQALGPQNAESVSTIQWADATRLTYIVSANRQRTLYLQAVGEDPLRIVDDLDYSLRYAVWLK